MNDHICAIAVPFNERGVQFIEMTYDVYTDDLENNLTWFDFPYEEINAIYGLIGSYCDKFDIWIDFHEEGEIKAENVPEALRMAQEFLANTSEPEKKATTKKIIEILSLAQSRNMPVGFYL